MRQQLLKPQLAKIKYLLSYLDFRLNFSYSLVVGRPGGNRTPNLRFWRPPLCQLSYWPKFTWHASLLTHANILPYSIIFATTPAPTVRPPSRIAKRKPSSIAIGACRLITNCTLSPGITISTPSGKSQVPVTSVVLK